MKEKRKRKAYYHDDDGWHKVSSWDLITLNNKSDVEYRKFYKTKCFYAKQDISSYTLGFNRLHKTFFYSKGQFPRSVGSHKGMTVSHVIAQEVISELEFVRFELDDIQKKNKEKVIYEFEITKKEEERPVIIDGTTYKTDVMLYFKKPYELAYRFNGQIAVEVFITSETRAKKIIDYERKRVAMVEIRLQKRFQRKSDFSFATEKEENDFKAEMKRSFSYQIYGQVLVDKESKAYEKDMAIQELKEQLQLKNQANNKLNEVISKNKEHLAVLPKLVDEYKLLKKELENQRQGKQQLHIKNKVLVDNIKNYEKQSLSKKLLDSITKKTILKN